MDSAVSAAIITAVATTAIGVLTILKKPNSNIPSRREIKYRQLTELFDPIEKLFFVRTPETDALSIFSEIYIITQHNLSLAPLDFLGTVLQIKESPAVTEADLAHLQAIVDSNYNYLRKYFGFPAAKTGISLKRRIRLACRHFGSRYLPLAAATLSLIAAFSTFVEEFGVNQNAFAESDIPFVAIALVSILTLLRITIDDVFRE